MQLVLSSLLRDDLWWLGSQTASATAWDWCWNDWTWNCYRQDGLKRKSAISLHQFSLFKTWKWHTPYQNASSWSAGHDLRPTRPLWPRQSWDPRVDQKKSYESSLLPWLKGMTLARPITPVHSVHIQKISRVMSARNPDSIIQGIQWVAEKVALLYQKTCGKWGTLFSNGLSLVIIPITWWLRWLYPIDPCPSGIRHAAELASQLVSNTRRSALIGTWARKALLVVIGDQTWHGKSPTELILKGKVSN